MTGISVSVSHGFIKPVTVTTRILFIMNIHQVNWLMVCKHWCHSASVSDPGEGHGWNSADANIHTVPLRAVIGDDQPGEEV